MVDKEGPISQELREKPDTFDPKGLKSADKQSADERSNLGIFSSDNEERNRTHHKREGSHSITSCTSEHGKDQTPNVEAPYIMGGNVLILLSILSITTSVISGSVQWANKTISQAQASVLMNGAAGPFTFVLTSAGLVGLSSFIVWRGNKVATIGSGMPEVKATLLNDFHHSDFHSIVSFKILCVRLFSLVAAAGSGLSIGSAAPLVHISICSAYVLMSKIPEFGEFLENHAIRKQVFAAAAAVGMATVFNAPIGGLLLSVELSSTFYLTSNFWRSFMVATTGAVWFRVFQLARSEEGHIFAVPVVQNPFLHWEYVVFALVGLLCGFLGLKFLKLHQAYFVRIKPYTLRYPVTTAACAGAMTAVLIYATGAYSARGVSESVIVHDMFQDCAISEMSSYPHVAPLGGLFASLLVRVVLSLIGTTLRISGGVFLPVLALGALGGRIVGQILAYACGDAINIYLAGYAMVGAVGFASATTHTISAAVIVIEQTGQFSMLVPCLLAAVIACGIMKSRSLSLYDQGMVNKGLESFELLMKDKSGHRYAADVMDEKVVSVGEKCTIQDLLTLLDNPRQDTFPLTNATSRLVGCIERADVFAFLKSVFDKNDLSAYLTDLAPADVEAHDRRAERLQRTKARNNLLNALGSRSTDSDDESTSVFPGTPSKGGYGLLGRTSSRLAGVHATRTDSRDDGRFGTDHVALADGDHEGPTAMNPLHAVPPTHTVQVSYATPPQSPKQDRAPKSTLVSSVSENSLQALDGLVKRLSGRISSFGAPVEDSSSGRAVRDAITQLRIDTLLMQNVDMMREPMLPVNGFPFTAHRFTTMDQLYVLFEMVNVQCVFVVSNTTVLEGMISKSLLMRRLKERRK